ncbi:unnamed protein product, partial [Mesorhabditis belari]|uniref:BPTI/Kunitz inhibitor domain-containing protein n=1 Tax=Mesorhabditis belari TaxID=2138241 RepID=A0AAF3ERB9_9BILA
MLLFICFLFFSTTLSETPGNPRARCFLPGDSGGCGANITHFYYNQERQLCLKLFYTGCGGNANNFDELHDCITLCHGAEMTLGSEPPTTFPSTIDPSTNPPMEPPINSNVQTT